MSTGAPLLSTTTIRAFVAAQNRLLSERPYEKRASGRKDP